MEFSGLLCQMVPSDYMVHTMLSESPVWLPPIASLDPVEESCVSSSEWSSSEWSRPRHDDVSTMVCRIVRGTDISDLPTEYKVEDLHLHEHPVIGTYMEQAIVAGFRYQVRCLGTQKYLFGGKPLVLKSIGMGYARRITFEGPILDNLNYFYSDSHPKGYGFSIVAVHAGDGFLIMGAGDRPLGDVCVDCVKSQQEVGSRTLPCGAIEKRILVMFTCTVHYSGPGNGILPLYADSTIDVTGVAVLVKPRGATKVSSTRIELEIPHIGACVLESM